MELLILKYLNLLNRNNKLFLVRSKYTYIIIKKLSTRVLISP
jgi:hypothetical protein